MIQGNIFIKVYPNIGLQLLHHYPHICGIPLLGTSAKQTKYSPWRTNADTGYNKILRHRMRLKYLVN